MAQGSLLRAATAVRTPYAYHSPGRTVLRNVAPPQVKRFATLPPDACLAPPLVAVWRNVEAESERYQVRLLGSAAGQLDTVHPRMG